MQKKEINQVGLEKIVELFRNSEIFAYPTETVFGIGGNPEKEEVVEKICRIKNRKEGKSFIVIADDLEKISEFANIPTGEKLQKMQELASQKPTTFLLEATEKAAKKLVINGKIAVRISPQKEVAEICNAVKSAIISTSANLSGKRAALSVEEVAEYFPNLPIYGKTCPKLPPSRIFDLEREIFLRN